MNLKTYITEHVISRRNNLGNRPKKYTSIYAIVEWVKRLGVENIVDWNGVIQEPKRGEILCEVGPQWSEKIATHWVKIMNCIKGPAFDYIQKVCIRPDECSFSDGKTETTLISFDKALDIIEEMVKKPKELVRI